jgi:hypothetical protein
MSYAVGFYSRTGRAAAVAIDVGGGGFAGRWEVDLCVPGTPAQLYHAAAGLPAARGEAFVRAGVEAVTIGAGDRLDDLLAALGDVLVVGVVTGNNPISLDGPVARILAAHPKMHAAEGQLYRDALLDAALARRLGAHAVPLATAETLLTGTLAATVAALGLAAGRPWRKDHKLAAVAALTAAAV